MPTTRADRVAAPDPIGCSPDPIGTQPGATRPDDAHPIDRTRSDPGRLPRAAGPADWVKKPDQNPPRAIPVRGESSRRPPAPARGETRRSADGRPALPTDPPTDSRRIQTGPNSAPTRPTDPCAAPTGTRTAPGSRCEELAEGSVGRQEGEDAPWTRTRALQEDGEGLLGGVAGRRSGAAGASPRVDRRSPNPDTRATRDMRAPRSPADPPQRAHEHEHVLTLRDPAPIPRLSNRFRAALERQRQSQPLASPSEGARNPYTTRRETFERAIVGLPTQRPRGHPARDARQPPGGTAVVAAAAAEKLRASRREAWTRAPGARRPDLPAVASESAARRRAASGDPGRRRCAAA